jgi:hypothetical protein
MSDDITIHLQKIRNQCLKKRKELGMSIGTMSQLCHVRTKTLVDIESFRVPKLVSSKQKFGWACSLTKITNFLGIKPEEWLSPFGLEPCMKISKIELRSFGNLLQKFCKTEDLEWLTVVSKGLPNPLTVEEILEFLELRLT